MNEKSLSDEQKKKMKVLFIGDIHIKFGNLLEVDKIISYVKENIHVDRIDMAVLAGDILDTHGVVHTQLMNKAYELVNSLLDNAIETYILVGNHDYIDNSQFCTGNHWMTGLGGNVVDKPISVHSIVLVPYVPKGKFHEALNLYLNKEWTFAKCIFAHQEFKGCKMGAIISEDGDMWDIDMPHVISGHIHERQRPQQNIYYPGSAINHSFGNDSQGISIFTINSDAIEEECINLNFIRKKILYMEVHEVIKDNSIVLDKNYKYSIEGTQTDIAEFKKTPKYKSMLQKSKVVFREKKKEKTRVEGKKFIDILHESILRESSDDLLEDYKYVVPK